jgi:hypothetical protein
MELHSFIHSFIVFCDFQTHFAAVVTIVFIAVISLVSGKQFSNRCHLRCNLSVSTKNWFKAIKSHNMLLISTSQVHWIDISKDHFYQGFIIYNPQKLNISNTEVLMWARSIQFIPSQPSPHLVHTQEVSTTKFCMNFLPLTFELYVQPILFTLISVRFLIFKMYVCKFYIPR